MATLTIQAAAQSLGTSEITIRRKLRTGQLSGHQEDPPNGRWWVEIPDDQLFDPASTASASRPEASEGHLLRDLVGVLKDQVSTLQHHLEIREREVGELHVIIQQQALALPAPGGNSRGCGEKFAPGVTEQRN